VTHGPGGVPLPFADVIRNVVAQAVLADEVGVDAIILGEHHRDDFAISTPETILAGIATTTSRIVLSSGVTVLSSDDPIRVSNDLPRLMPSHGGRAEIIAWGADPSPNHSPSLDTSWRTTRFLFEEKLNLFCPNC
jgi:alkanesulfonate monooxygenase SsuD/methylene tetrahydromethanopterin reductase-like flavin-dependent oxidoreductase (luciferase family)